MRMMRASRDDALCAAGAIAGQRATASLQDACPVGGRPATSVQRQVQRMASGSARVRQLQALQRGVDGSPLQMKAFATDKLNLAGEDHNESNVRRAQEADVSRQATGGGYWTEDSFQLEVNGRQVGADPRILQFLACLHSLQRLWQTLLTTTLSADFIPGMAQRILTATGPLIDLTERLYAESSGDRYSGGDQLTEEQGQTRDRINAGRHAHFHEAVERLGQLSGLDAGKQAEKALIGKSLDGFRAAANEMTKNLMEKGNLDVLRSHAMHAAAKKRSGVIGVWKIGQAHVSDIKHDIVDDPQEYNLMTQDEFNAECSRIVG